jgi:hypothetical protein
VAVKPSIMLQALEERARYYEERYLLGDLDDKSFKTMLQADTGLCEELVDLVHSRLYGMRKHGTSYDER